MSFDNTIDFKDHIVQYPNRFKQTTVSPGVVELVPTWITNSNEIIEPGTPVDSELFKKLKQNVTIYQQTFTTTENQTIINLNRDFLVGQNRVSLSIGGVRQYTGQDYTETDSHTLTMTTPQKGGLKAEVIMFTASQVIAEDFFEKTVAAIAATQAANDAAAQALAAKETAYTVQLTPVMNFVAIETTYPTAVNGSEVQTLDDGKIYRKENESWVYRKSLTPGPVVDFIRKLELQKYYVDVKEFGAVGDSVTDDTQALRAAFSSGLPLYFRKGMHCKITDSLSVPAGKELKIIGSGKDNCSIKLTIKGKRLAYVNGDNTELEGISFYGTGQGFVAGETENGALLDFIGKGGHIHNCRFKDADYLSVLVKPTSGEFIITNNIFENAWAEEIAYWANDGQIKNNTFKNCKNNAIVTRGSDDVLIEGNLFQNIGYDIDAAIDIRNSYDPTPRACQRISIHNNHFIDCHFPLSSLSETTARHEEITITNNKFANPSAISYDNGIRLEHCKNITFDNNKVKNLGSVHSVLISASEKIVANGNTINTGNHGMNLNGDDFVEAKNNKLINLNGKGIIVRCPSTVPNTVSVNENGFYGVDIGIETDSVYVGRLQCNTNFFKNIGTVALKIKYALSQLNTMSNIFADGNLSKTVLTLIQPTLWVKGGNVNYDFESGGSSVRPSNPTIGQQFFDTSLNKPIFCRNRATLGGNGLVTSSAIWIDGNGNVI